MKNNYFTINNLLLCLITLIPPFLITGPLIPEILMNLAGIVFLIIIYKNKDYKFFNNYYSFFFLAFFIYISLRSLFTEEIFLSLKSSILYFRFYLLSLSIWYILENKESFVKILLYVFCITQISLILDALLQYKLGFNIFGWGKIHPERVSGFFGDELILGSYLVRFLPLIIGLYILKNFDTFNLKKTFFLIFLIYLIYLGISISGDRTAFYLSLIFLSFLFFLIRIEYLKKKIIPLLLVFISVLLLTIFFNENLKKRIFTSTINSVISFDNVNNIQLTMFSHNHEIHIKTAIKMYTDNKLFGVGIKQYRFKCKDKKYFINRHSCVTHPHNTYIQFLAELGTVGFLFLLTFLIYIIVQIYINILKNEKKPNSLFKLLILSSIFINLFPFAPSGNFFNNWLSMIYFFPLGFYFYSKKN